ncbi:prevent-host-death protein [Candidatus Dojkabacteria bacterium]|nr:prevent-host-death protein [Candidatus Dojkabacteria bacterium]
MTNQISANFLKTQGISAIDKLTSDGEEVLVSVRGKTKYVIYPIEKYDMLRDQELSNAYTQTLKDINAKKYRIESVTDHVKRIKNV